MADVISEYVAWSDNANEYAAEQVQTLSGDALEDIDNLMLSAEERDDELWDSLGVDVELIASEYEDVDTEERDLNWSLGLSAMASASGLQFFLKNRDPLLIFPAAYRAQVMSPFNLTRDQIIRAGKRDAVKVTISGYQQLEQKYIKEFSFLKKMSNADLYAELQNVHALQSLDKYTTDSMGYVSRMTSYPKGSAQYKEAVSDLVNVQSSGAQQRMNRRSLEGLSVDRQIAGDESILMVWMLDPTSSHCSYCPDRAGEIKTYAEWANDGLPGAGVCKGGDRCNCHLVMA